MRINRTNVLIRALAVLALPMMYLCSCAQSTISDNRSQDRVIEGKPTSHDLSILQAWSGDYPFADLGLLPADQRKERVGYIIDKATFTAVWQAMNPSRTPPEVDFTGNIVVFIRNVVYYNRTSIVRIILKNGIADVLATETMSALPIEDKVAMAMAVIPRNGVNFIQTGSGPAPVK
jgi:hypothetical protein